MADRPRRVLMISYEFPPLGGGGAKVAHGLARRLVSRGYEVDVLTMWFRGLQWREDVDGIHVHRVPCWRTHQSMCYAVEMIPYLLFALPYALWLAATRSYSLNHTHFIFPDALVSTVIRWVTGLRFVVTAHGSDVPGYNPNRFILLHRILTPLWKLVARSATAVICPSEHIASLVKRADDRVATTVIPNGIELDKFQCVHNDGGNILAVTRIFERKGIQYLVDALKGSSHGRRVEVIGDGPYLADCIERAKRQNVQVDFLGFIDNDSDALKRHFEAASIFVFPSASENFPIVLLEAMAAGCAIVTTRNTGCAEVVGDAAVLIDARDAGQIREALQSLLGDPAYCRALAEKARRRVESMFSWQRVLDRHVDLYQSASVRRIGSET